MSETVTKINMCKHDHKSPMSFCGAAKITNQINCTYYWPHSRAKHCMWHRADFAGACDNLWAQRKIEMPAGVIALLKGKS